MSVPEDIGCDGVQSHSPGHAKTVLPVGARDARVVHLTGDDPEWFAVENELAVLYGETVGRGLLCRRHTRRDCQGDEEEKAKPLGEHGVRFPGLN